MDAGAKERFAGVDIAHADDDGIVHDQRFDRAFALLALRDKIAGVEGRH